MRSIAITSTYAPSEEFGGPARIYHMRRLLERHGYSVTHVVVDSGGGRGALRKSDLRISHHLGRRPFDPIYDDVRLGDDAKASSTVDAVADHLRKHRVALVIMEQPYLAEMVTAVAHHVAVPVIYSAANIEYKLRQELEQFARVRERTGEESGRVRDLERLSTRVSMAATAICRSDAETLTGEFGKNNVIVVPNGTVIAEKQLHAPGVADRSRPYFAFAGSAYWPNTEGLACIAEPSLAFLPPDVRVEVAGSVCGPLQDHPGITRHRAVNLARLSLHGFLPMDQLVALMSGATAVLVPITVGQGSNLKTADALACGAPVILTQKAMSGYEDVIGADASGVTVTSSIQEFRRAMLDSLHSASERVGVVGNERRQLLAWDKRLQPLVDLVDDVVGKPGSGSVYT